MEQRIIIRHLEDEGSRVDEFLVRSLTELLFGRDEACQVRYDDDRAGMVSRRHAELTIRNVDPLEAVIIDLGSRNGTFVNSRRIQGEVRLSPGDHVRLGPGGPEFRFDVYPPTEKREVPRQPLGTEIVVLPEPQSVVRQASPVPPRPSPPSTPRRLVLLAGLALMVAGLGLVRAWAMSRGRGELTYRVY